MFPIRFSWVYIFVVVALALASCVGNNEKVADGDNGEKTETKSESILDKLISLDPENPDLYNQRALSYLDQNMINDALSDINMALQLDSTRSDYFVTLSSIYLAMGKISNCILSLDVAEELDPENKDAILKRAEVYLIIREYKVTFEQIQILLAMDEFNPKAYFIRGLALLETGDTAMAVRSLMTAVEQDQQYYEAYMQLGYLYASLGDPLAEGYYNNAINTEPNNPDPYYFLGIYYQEQENIDKAVRIYDQLLSLDSVYIDAWYNLGYLNLVYISDYEKAVQYFTHAIELNPDYTEAYYNRGYSNELSGDFTLARKDYLKATEITPNYDLAVKGLNRLDRR